VVEWVRGKALSIRIGSSTLAIPATSIECERIFSSAKKLITPERSCLGDDVIEASECLKAWGIVGLPSNTRIQQRGCWSFSKVAGEVKIAGMGGIGREDKIDKIARTARAAGAARTARTG
jgi:hypothetical protein